MHAASLAALVLCATLLGQSSATLRIEVRSQGRPIAGALVALGATSHETDAQGVVTARVAEVQVSVTVTAEGFAPQTRAVTLQPGEPRTVVFDLEPATFEEQITVEATRTGRRIDDQPTRVEVLQREEIEEKMLMTPGDIVMMLNEMGGMRVQATSPSLGAASVRIQGMRGRYTRFLSDGLPLFGEQPGGLGLLQIPPMDLGQVEVIKGTASALHGAGAMGGVVNLVSRRPGEDRERELLLNRSTRGGTDAILWWPNPLPRGWGITTIAGGHWQQQEDVDDDGWADLAGYSRAVVRPRVFWDGADGRSFFATTGMTWEDRRGGTMDDRELPGTGAPYREQLDTLRVDAGALGQMLVGGRYVLTARAAASRQRHTHRFGTARERDRHQNAFGEVALRGAAGGHTWVAGAAIEHNTYSPRDVPAFAYSHTVPGIFVQDDLDLSSRVSVSGSARLDRHSQYGWFASPRVSVLFRASEWTARLSGGTGFFAPTALTEETEAAGLTRLTIPRPLQAERGRSASVDLTRSAGPASATLTLFVSRVAHPLQVQRENQYTLTNLEHPATNTGLELLGTIRQAPFALTASYTFVRSRQREGAGLVDAPLTPRHSAGLVAMIESEETGRLGLEVYYTGRQRLEINPYRGRSEPYVIVGVLVERRFGSIRVFLNGENLTSVRQSRWDPLLRGTPPADGRWAVDAWAPLEGRTINGGLRIAF